jgi:hypothetical protein
MNCLRTLGRRPLPAANSFRLGRYLSDPQRHEKIACSIPTTNAKTSPAEDIANMKKKIRAIMPKTPDSIPDESALTYRSQFGVDKEGILEESLPAPYDVKEALYGNTSLEETHRQDPERLASGATTTSLPHYTLLEKGAANKGIQRSSLPLRTRMSADPSAVVVCTPPPSRPVEYYIPIGNIQTSSTTDSSSSSEESDSYDEVNCFVPLAYAGLVALQLKHPIRTSMTTIQMRSADRLMKEFFLKLSIDWQKIYVKQHGPSSYSNSNSNLGSGTRREDSAKGKGTKRPRRNKEGQSSDDEKDEEGCRRPEGVSTSNDFAGISSYFACPYRKRNPRKYCVRDWRPCALTGLKSISRVK